MRVDVRRLHQPRPLPYEAHGDRPTTLELERRITRLLQQNSRLRQENSRLTSKLADALMVVRIPTHIHDDDGYDDATVAASNLTDANLCGAVSEQWDGDAHPAAEVPTDDEDVAVA